MMNLRVYWDHHCHAFVQGFRQLSGTPIATLLTLSVLAITIMLPSGLLVLLNNANKLTARWNNGATITLYLPVGMPDSNATRLLQKVQLQSGVKEASYISPEQGMQQFSQASGFKTSFAALKDNPLPGVIEVVPNSENPLRLQQLKVQLQQLPQVQAVKLDLQWVQRLFSIVNLSKQVVYGIFIALALAVLLIIGNTIRMIVQRYERHMDVMRLVGASSGFVRRPFLYAGAMYGFSAGILAALMLSLLFSWLQHSVRELALLYNSEFYLSGIGIKGLFYLLLISTSLGYLGAWSAIKSQRLSLKHKIN